MLKTCPGTATEFAVLLPSEETIFPKMLFQFVTSLLAQPPTHTGIKAIVPVRVVQDAWQEIGTLAGEPTGE